ncbi:MAG: cupin domain-containing protein [Myxococcota bacterium]
MAKHRMSRVSGGFLIGLLAGCATAAVGQATFIEEGKSLTQGKVITAKDAPIRYAPNGKAEVALYATGREAFVGVLAMAPGAGVPMHRDPTEEFIYIMEGGGTITIDGEQFDAQAGNVIYMPAGSEVQFANGPRPLKALQIFANPGPETKYDAWSSEPTGPTP